LIELLISTVEFEKKEMQVLDVYNRAWIGEAVLKLFIAQPISPAAPRGAAFSDQLLPSLPIGSLISALGTGRLFCLV
jgi:hypothetical protein